PTPARPRTRLPSPTAAIRLRGPRAQLRTPATVARLRRTPLTRTATRTRSRTRMAPTQPRLRTLFPARARLPWPTATRRLTAAAQLLTQALMPRTARPSRARTRPRVARLARPPRARPVRRTPLLLQATRVRRPPTPMARAVAAPAQTPRLTRP